MRCALYYLFHMGARNCSRRSAGLRALRALLPAQLSNDLVRDSIQIQFDRLAGPGIGGTPVVNMDDRENLALSIARRAAEHRSRARGAASLGSFLLPPSEGA